MATLDFKGPQNSPTICICETYSQGVKHYFNYNTNLKMWQTPAGSVVNVHATLSQFQGVLP